MGILIIIVAAQPSAQNVLRLNCSKMPAGVSGAGGGMVAGPCCVTDNAEGMTHDEMQAPCPPPGMETTERMNCSGQDCGDKTFRDTRHGHLMSPLQFSPRLKWKKIWEEKKLFHLSSLPALVGGSVVSAAFGYGVRGKRSQAV